ncbi:tfdA family taurine dioxygenase [Gonapodya prolifera JEL478]|uniref:TfdA family taurine dioxygenase n=1 Tax=Gonapodya prolifera (strain JEL478) TaxID=1344416 RepID=A0A139A3C7_GONPJ|nr:tfdA family taurine dioxygenase [Gonapodya prolifera JEL478]|eukprot:KXS11270.1 tfdA family taurine dioxygenase [Gonapodya prolifera JEL478]
MTAATDVNAPSTAVEVKPSIEALKEQSAALSDLASPDIEEKVFPQYIPAEYPPIPVLEVVDRGLRADPKKRSLLSAATKVIHLTPTIGTELHGLQLNKLTDQQKDELALLAAERGVVFFRDQDISVKEQLDLGRYYGPLHFHPTTGAPKDHPEVHVVYADKNSGDLFASNHTRQWPWHTDVSYSASRRVTVPHVGGDTLWVNTYQAYETLSVEHKELIEGRFAVHSAKEQADNGIKAGHPLKRAPVDHEHPIVRTHPVTGWKALNVNPIFTRRIVGLPKDVSDRVLQFLYDHISNGEDFKVRLNWKKNTVAVWDNRNTIHYAITDYYPARRHGVRVTPHAEAPFYDPQSKGQFEDVVARGYKGGALGV